MDQAAEAAHGVAVIDVAGLFEPGQSAAAGEVRLQDFGAASCVFVRLAGAARIAFVLDGVEGLDRPAGGGWLVSMGAVGKANYWLPAAPVCRRIDDDGHVRDEHPAVLLAAELHGGCATITLAAPPAGATLDLALWRLPRALADEIRFPSPLELQPAYLWGSHTVYGRASDLYLHLVHGRVYENRYAWPLMIRIFSENDAHAICVQLMGLRRATGRRLPGLLAQQVMESVLGRIGADGGFHHGEWTDLMEAHCRLHCSAMHLMMDALDEQHDPAVERALTAAADFMARQSSRLSFGVWLLHDDLEHSVERMKQSPLRWVHSELFGKAASNMLVLNSHLDAIIALDRYMQLTGDRQFSDLVLSARAAANAVLSLRSAEPLYRVLFRLIDLTFLPSKLARALPLWQRALKRVTWKYLIPRLPDIKARFPRLVMPGGYIDRDLVQRHWALDYHAVNLMDLARYLRRFDEPVVRAVLVQGLEFTRRSGILESWQELGYRKYALGFWAEALYHVCTLLPDPRYRQWLAESMLVLEDLALGQPPSLLGANAEAVPVADQTPCPSPAAARLRVANLGRRGAPELLVVNATDTALPLTWEIAPVEPLAWHRADGNPARPHALQVPARGWLWARAAN